MNSVTNPWFLPLMRSVLLAVVVLPCMAVAQNESDSDPAATPPDTLPEAHQQYLALIDTIELEQGVNAAELIEPLTALSQLYLADGLYAEASTGFDRARSVVRINSGFSTVQELELLRLQVKAEEAAGHFEAAWELEKTVLMIARENSADLATHAVFKDFAGKRLEILDQYRSGHFPPQIVLGCYYGRGKEIDSFMLGDSQINLFSETKQHCGSGDRPTVLISLLREARTFQVAAIETLLKNDVYADPRLQQLVADLLRTSDSLHRLMRTHNDPFLGLAMQRVLGYPPHDAATLQQQALFLVQLADTNVRNASSGTRPAGYEAVIAQYLKAYTQLSEAGVAPTALAAIFSPAVPVMLPSYAANPLEPLDATAAAAYIDVEFDITRYGRSQHIEITSTTEGVTRADKSALVRLIRDNRFRPYLSDGQFADSTHVVARYPL